MKSVREQTTNGGWVEVHHKLVALVKAYLLLDGSVSYKRIYASTDYINKDRFIVATEYSDGKFVVDVDVYTDILEAMSGIKD